MEKVSDSGRADPGRATRIGYRPPAMEALGLIPLAGGGCSARVWAPAADEVAVVVAEREYRLDRDDDETFVGDVPLAPGDACRFRLDDRADEVRR